MMLQLFSNPATYRQRISIATIAVPLWLCSWDDQRVQEVTICLIGAMAVVQTAISHEAVQLRLRYGSCQ